MTKVTKIETFTSDKIWKQEMDQFLDKYGFDAFSQDTEYDNLQKKVQAYSTETDTTERNKLRLEMSKLISPSSSSLESLKKITPKTSDGQVKVKIKCLCMQNLRDFPIKVQFDELIEGARELAAGTDDIAAEKKIRDNLPPLRATTIDHINEYRDVSKVVHNKWVTGLQDIRKVSKVHSAGRLPGADRIFRNILEKIIAKDPNAYFTKKSFDELFIVSQTGGAQMRREALPILGKRTRGLNDGNDAPKKRAKDTAANDANRNAIQQCSSQAIVHQSRSGCTNGMLHAKFKVH